MIRGEPKPWKKATARPGKANVEACARRIAREYRRAADALEAACKAPDPLAAAVDALSMGRAWRHMMFLTSSIDRRDLRRGVGRYARKAVRS